MPPTRDLFFFTLTEMYTNNCSPTATVYWDPSASGEGNIREIVRFKKVGGGAGSGSLC